MRKRKYQGMLLVLLLSWAVAVGSGFSVNAEENVSDSTEYSDDNYIINLPYYAEEELPATGENYSVDNKQVINLADNSADGLSGNVQLIDQAGLLTESEAEELEAMIEKLEDKTGWDVMAVTTADAQGMTATYYAEKWLDEHMLGEDGIIYLIDMDNHEIVVSGTGEVEEYLTDEHKESILSEGYIRVNNEEYARTFFSMIHKTGKYAYRQITVVELVIAIGIAIAMGGLTIGGIIASYRLKFGGYKYSTEKSGSVNLRRSEDVFVNCFVTHKRISKSDVDNGGNTTHMGAGGRTYSSGSRKF